MVLYFYIYPRGLRRVHDMSGRSKAWAVIAKLGNSSAVVARVGCLVRTPDYVYRCTRDAGHTGPHIAMSGEKNICAMWGQTDEDRADGARRARDSFFACLSKP